MATASTCKVYQAVVSDRGWLSPKDIALKSEVSQRTAERAARLLVDGGAFKLKTLDKYRYYRAASGHKLTDIAKDIRESLRIKNR